MNPPFGQSTGQNNHHNLPPGATYSRPTLLGRGESWARPAAPSSSLQQAVQNRKRRYSLIQTSPTAASGSSHYPPRYPPVRLSHRPRHSNEAMSNHQPPPPAPPQVIDLTRDDIPSTTSHQQPRWQPDAEALSCYVCHNRFNIINRRHHCR